MTNATGTTPAATPMVPATRPRWTREDVKRALQARTMWRDSDDTSAILVGVRGYYRDTMGELGLNDVGIYDDAIFLTSPHVHAGFNANVDPSVKHPHVATLVPGRYLYALGIHNISKARSRQYRALVQAGPVFVSRQGQGTIEEGWFGINIHKGSWRTTSSEGCQTIHPDQWRAFFSVVESEMLRAPTQTAIPYVLLSAQG